MKPETKVRRIKVGRANLDEFSYLAEKHGVTTEEVAAAAVELLHCYLNGIRPALHEESRTERLRRLVLATRMVTRDGGYVLQDWYKTLVAE